MLTFPRRLALGLLLLLITISASAQAPQTVTVTKCQDCGTKASKALQSCMAAGGGAVPGCQKTYQKRMTHCNKKWCNPKTTKVKVKTGS